MMNNMVTYIDSYKRAESGNNSSVSDHVITCNSSLPQKDNSPKVINLQQRSNSYQKARLNLLKAAENLDW